MSRYKSRRYPAPLAAEVKTQRPAANSFSARYWFHEFGINQLIYKLERLVPRLRASSADDIRAIITLLEGVVWRESLYRRVGAPDTRKVEVKMIINGKDIEHVDLQELAR